MTRDEAGGRLDRTLVSWHPELTRSRIKRLVEEGRVTVNEGVVKAGYVLRFGETVCLDLPAPPSVLPVPESIPLIVVHEDEDLLVIDKPAGLTVHPGAGRSTGTLVNALLGRGTPLSSVGAPLRPGIVHRLDRGTSGLLIVAKTDAAHRELARALAAREVARRYVAIVWGVPPEGSGCIIGALARSRSDRRRMRVVKTGGREAVTRFRVCWSGDVVSVVALALETGRTHQIRVHFRHLGHPVFGDPDYGGRTGALGGVPAPLRPVARAALAELPRQALHAARLRFRHPGSGAWLEFKSDVPADMRQAAAILGIPAGGWPADEEEDP